MAIAAAIGYAAGPMARTRPAAAALDRDQPPGRRAPARRARAAAGARLGSGDPRASAAAARGAAGRRRRPHRTAEPHRRPRAAPTPGPGGDVPVATVAPAPRPGRAGARGAAPVSAPAHRDLRLERLMSVPARHLPRDDARRRATTWPRLPASFVAVAIALVAAAGLAGWVGRTVSARRARRTAPTGEPDRSSARCASPRPVRWAPERAAIKGIDGLPTGASSLRAGRRA